MSDERRWEQPGRRRSRSAARIAVAGAVVATGLGVLQLVGGPADELEVVGDDAPDRESPDDPAGPADPVDPEGSLLPPPSARGPWETVGEEPLPVDLMATPLPDEGLAVHARATDGGVVARTFDTADRTWRRASPPPFVPFAVAATDDHLVATGTEEVGPAGFAVRELEDGEWRVVASDNVVEPRRLLPLGDEVLAVGVPPGSTEQTPSDDASVRRTQTASLDPAAGELSELGTPPGLENANLVAADADGEVALVVGLDVADGFALRAAAYSDGTWGAVAEPPPVAPGAAELVVAGGVAYLVDTERLSVHLLPVHLVAAAAEADPPREHPLHGRGEADRPWATTHAPTWTRGRFEAGDEVVAAPYRDRLAVAVGASDRPLLAAVAPTGRWEDLGGPDDRLASPGIAGTRGGHLLLWSDDAPPWLREPAD